MTTTVKCIKCGEDKPALAAPPFRAGTRLGPLGEEIQQKVCSPCYKDWIAMSVKLVNELRLDTTDPRGQEMWLKQMKIFLNLDESSDPWARHLDKRVVVETVDGRTVTATLIGADEHRLTFSDFDGGLPAGFDTGANKGSGALARDAIKTVEPAA
ncbi:MAG: Fe(2+)-trafficking protein [Deltaproteobacteria bacterium]|nr:Fe(2+)-trafficking protein [Myxococcales bacterium]MDP3219093.1 Fe(2+)-trafficking protein [Deltaproteobacteria bacterium]